MAPHRERDRRPSGRTSMPIRVLAPNPGPFTLEGTNTWVVGAGPALVIDPGPPDPEHIEAVRGQAGSIEAILLTPITQAERRSWRRGAELPCSPSVLTPVRSASEMVRRWREGVCGYTGCIRPATHPITFAFMTVTPVLFSRETPCWGGARAPSALPKATWLRTCARSR
jgi:hypothetical protein